MHIIVVVGWDFKKWRKGIFKGMMRRRESKGVDEDAKQFRNRWLRFRLIWRREKTILSVPFSFFFFLFSGMMWFERFELVILISSSNRSLNFHFNDVLCWKQQCETTTWSHLLCVCYLFQLFNFCSIYTPYLIEVLWIHILS